MKYFVVMQEEEFELSESVLLKYTLCFITFSLYS